MPEGGGQLTYASLEEEGVTDRRGLVTLSCALCTVMGDMRWVMEWRDSRVALLVSSAPGPVFFERLTLSGNGVS